MDLVPVYPHKDAHFRVLWGFFSEQLTGKHMLATMLQFFFDCLPGQGGLWLNF